MPTFFDEPVHQYATQRKEHHAGAYKRGGDEKITAFAHLEPRCFGERDVGSQKHQSKQRRDDDIDDLADGFRQALRRLRYQSF